MFQLLWNSASLYSFACCGRRFSWCMPFCMPFSYSLPLSWAHPFARDLHFVVKFLQIHAVCYFANYRIIRRQACAATGIIISLRILRMCTVPGARRLKVNMMLSKRFEALFLPITNATALLIDRRWDDDTKRLSWMLVKEAICAGGKV